MEELSKCWCICVSVGRDEMCHLRESIDNHEDGVESVGAWKLCDEVERNILPRRFWRLKWHERSIRTRISRLGDLALWARANIIKNVCTKLRAKEMFLDEGVHFMEARVASKL